MARHKLPSIPLVEARHVGKKQRPTAIVLKLSFTTSDKGAALGIASFLHQKNSPEVSHHYIVDNEMTYMCLPGRTAAYGSPRQSISVLVCAEPHEIEAMWEDAIAKPVIYRAASLVATLMLHYKIRPRYLTGEAEEKWLKHKWRRRGGIIVQIPGTWPYESFLQDVISQMEQRR